MENISLSLSLNEVNALLGVLGDTYTKSGTYPLLLKIKVQAESQIKQAPAQEAAE